MSLANQPNYNLAIREGSYTVLKLVYLLLLATSLGASAQSQQIQANPSDPITVATWNAEHLVYPPRKGCNPRRSRDIKLLKAYTESLKADVIAFQEVHSEQAVRQVLPDDGWQVIISGRSDSPVFQCRGSGKRSTQQKVAFAVKQGIEVIKVDNFS